MDLRDYQWEMIAKLREAILGGSKRVVVQAPTGAGKTVVAAAIVKSALEKGNRVIFAVPALELIDQTVARFESNGIHAIGVMQGMHFRTDPNQPVQVCSVQTLNRRTIPVVDLVIIDECHVQFNLFKRWMWLPQWQNVPFVGLTATPWAKGMGQVWQKLVVGVTLDDLIKRGVLSDFKVFAPSHPDLRGVKLVRGDYDIHQLAKAVNTKPLVADIVSTWLEKGENRPTLAFAVNRVHAKHIQEQFAEAGVSSGYVDAYTPMEERRELADKFANGEIKIIANVGVLTTGVDWDVRCLILARPTKSEILYTQIIGRALRTAPGKDYAIILDHSDTTLRLGFVNDIHYEELDNGRRDKPLVKKRELLPKECPKCHFVKPVKVRECPACGFVPEPVNKVDTEAGELLELTRNKKSLKKVYTIREQMDFYSEVLRYARDHDYSDGWAWYQCRDRFGVKPTIKPMAALSVSPQTQAWLKHKVIQYHKRKSRDANKVSSTGSVG